MKLISNTHKNNVEHNAQYELYIIGTFVYKTFRRIELPSCDILHNVQLC